MKKAFIYLGVVLSFALMGTFSACSLLEQEEAEAELILAIKTFSPTKVVPGVEVTINGSCFNDVKEVVFPDEVKVTTFRKVTNEMLKVTVPAGISGEGGKLFLRGESVLAESPVAITVGNTVISGYSKQAGEEITGGEQLTIFGTDLEFINKVELLDSDGNPNIIEDKAFYRKGTNSVIIIIPKKNIYEGSWVGKVYTIDGKVFNLPELSYTPSADEGGHWETVKVPVWTNEDPAGNGAVSWSGKYRFALEGHDGAGECIAEFPADVWNMLMTQTFYIDVEATDPQIRVTNGWWDANWKAGDLQPGNELLTDNEDGTWTAAVNLSDDADFVATLEEKHILITGDRFTPMAIYYTEEQWVEGGGGHMETVKTSIWKGDGTDGAVSWNGKYRFALEGHDGAGECIAEIPQDVWDKMLTETFYIDVEATDPQIRVTNGWWDASWKVGDLQPGNELLTDNEDGTWTAAVNLSDDPDFVATLEEKHILITGDRFTPIEIYFTEEVWVGGGESGPTEVVFWESDGTGGAVSWNGKYRFALEGHDGAGECIAELPQDVWDKVLSQTFYLDVEATDPQIRVTNGWWDASWVVGDLQPGNEFLTDNEDGTWTATINISADADFIATVEEKHILLTGDRFTPLKLYFLE